MAVIAHEELWPLVESIATGSRGALAIVAGPGAGKSSTLTRAAERARAAGLTVAEISLGNGGGVSLSATLASLGSEGTVVLIDDAHLASAEELRAIAAVCERDGSTRLSVITTLRPWPRAAAREWALLARRGYASVVEIAPVDGDGVERILVEELGTTPDRAIVEMIRTLCGGNPLLIAECARSLGVAASAPETENEFVERISRSIGSAAELLRLDGDQRRLLEAASVLGSRFRASVAIDMAGFDGTEHDAIEGLWHLGVLREGPGRAIEFALPLVQRTIYAQLTRPTRSRLHARAFAALLRHGFERRAAEHATLADLAGDDDAIKLLARVARSDLRAGAAARAAKRFRDAIDLANDRATPAMHLGLAEALVHSGNGPLAARTVERLLREADLAPQDRVEAIQALAMCLASSGERRQALQHLQLAAEFGKRHDSSAVAGIMLDIALLCIRIGDVAGARAALDTLRAVTLDDATSLQETLTADIVAALHNDAGACARVDRTALEVLYHALPLAHEHHRIATLVALCGIVLVSTAQDDTAGALTTTALRLLGRHLPKGALARLLAIQAHIQLHAGNVDAAEKAAADAVDAAADVPADLPLALAASARVLFQRGKLTECATVCERATAALRGGGNDGALELAWLESVRGSLALSAGSIEQAGRYFGKAFAVLREAEMTLPAVGGWEILGVTSLVRAGNAGAARELLPLLAPPGAAGSPMAATITDVTNAVLAEVDGRLEDAASLLQEASEHARDAGAALDRLAIAWLHGALLRRIGRVADSRRVCMPAFREAESRGASMLAQLLERELVVTLTGRGRRRTAPGELTAAEQRVVELAATGRSNREIAGQLWISINTVQTHLQRAYSKLGVKDRSELARAAVLTERAGPA